MLSHRGLLAKEEDELVQLRVTKEAEAWKVLQEDETLLEKEISTTGVSMHACMHASAWELSKTTTCNSTCSSHRPHLPPSWHFRSPNQAGKLCATPFGVDVVGISLSTALIGALVGGVAAARRKDEVCAGSLCYLQFRVLGWEI